MSDETSRTGTAPTSNRLVVADIGGTHARFAIANMVDGRLSLLGEVVTLRTADHASFEAAWTCFRAMAPAPLPRAVAIAVAALAREETIYFTNNPWVIHPARLPTMLGIERYTIVNDFEAVGHAVAYLREDDLVALCGPDIPLPRRGVISVIGPGTGLGVASVWRDGNRHMVQATEGGHIDFAPLDAFEDALLARLRQDYRRVSVERIVSGPGIVAIYQTLASLEGCDPEQYDDMMTWQRGMDGVDRLAIAAVDRFCLSLGSIAGDIALAQGASAVVVAGGLGQRLRAHLARPEFAGRFRAKGRFEAMMADIPVKLIVHPQPGLLGAAAAFFSRFPEHREGHV